MSMGAVLYLNRLIKNNSFVESLCLTIVFICISIISIFIFPDVDDKIFNLSTDNNLKSFVLYSLNYGNGRFLGNFFEAFFSHNYYIKFLFVALILTLIICFLYKLFFNRKPEFIFLVAFAIIIPCEDFLQYIYFSFSAFSNYVIPILFFLISLFLMKKVKLQTSNSKFLFYFLIFVFLLSSCLFSENTSLLIFAFYLLNFLTNTYKNKKTQTADIVLLISAFIGIILMFLIPGIFNVSNKLDTYREFYFSFSDAIFSLFYFVDLITEMLFPIFILSFSVLLYSISRTKTFFDKICLIVITAFPFFLILFNDISFINDYYRLILSCFFGIYLLLILCVLLRIASDDVKQTTFIFMVMFILSIIPMTFINVNGTRTFYTTFIIMLFFGLYLVSAESHRYYESIMKKNSKAIFISLVSVLLVVTLFLFNDSVRKFDSFVIENETGETPTVEKFDNIIGTGFNFNMHKYAIDNIKYLNPANVKLWPKEDWLDFLQ